MTGDSGSTVLLLVPLNTVCVPFSVRTRKNPRWSRPSVVPSRFEPLSSMRTALPCTQEEFSAKRRRIDSRASEFSSNWRYSRSSDFSKAAANSTRDHSLPVSRRSEVAPNSFGKARLIHVDADSHHDVANPGGFGIHLGENAADFLAAVGPTIRRSLGHFRSALTRESTC